MTTVFLSGAMSWPPLLDKVGGRRFPDIKPACMNNAAVYSVPSECYPVSGVAAGQSCDGVLIEEADTATMDQFRYFAACLGMVPTVREVTAVTERIAAVTFLCECPTDRAETGWDKARWIEQWGDRAVWAAQEIMGYMGRLSLETLRARMHMILARAEARAAAATPAPAKIRSDLAAKDVRVLNLRTPHEGYFLTRQYDLQHPGFDGMHSDIVTREVFVATDAAIVLPYDPVRDRVLLVEQFRMGPFGRGDPLPWVLEPVAGRVDPGEVPEETARRECVEEAGLNLSDIEHVSSHYCSPGCSTEMFHCYVGLCDLPDLQKGQGGLDSEDEDIRTNVLTFEEAIALCSSGEANIGPLVLILFWLQRERERLRARA